MITIPDRDPVDVPGTRALQPQHRLIDFPLVRDQLLSNAHLRLADERLERVVEWKHHLRKAEHLDRATTEVSRRHGRGRTKGTAGHDKLDNSPALELFHATQAVEAEHLTLQLLLARQHKFARLEQNRQKVL